MVKMRTQKKHRLYMSLLLFSMLILTSCSPASDQSRDASEGSTVSSSEGATEAEISVAEKLILSGFETMTKNAPKALEPLAEYLKKNQDNLSAQVTDEMIVLYEKAQMTLLSKYQDEFFEGDIQEKLLSYSMEELNKIDVSEADLKKLLSKLEPIGLKLEQVEGTVFPVVDYRFFEPLLKSASEEVKAYYRLLMKESDFPVQKDGGLAVSWDEVFTRAALYNLFVEKYPETRFKERVVSSVTFYQNLVLVGSVNTPMYDRDTGEMTPEAKAALIAYVTEGDDSPFKVLMTDYLATLESEGFKKTPKVEAFINEHLTLE